MTCNTCGKEESPLYRVVVDVNYNALLKPPLWNCKECYEKKKKKREVVAV